MSTPDIPLIDIAAWRSGDAEQRQALAVRLDAAMQDSGFFLVSGHGIDPGLLADIRAAAKRFFGLPAEQKEPYRTRVGGRGWLAKGAEANAFYGEAADASKADLKESLTLGRDFSTGDPEIDEEWFLPNVWPAEVPELERLSTVFMDQARALYDDLLTVLATALGLPEGYFRERAQRSPHTYNINRYPALTETGAAQEGQYRVAPHTDWGMLTILDRQPGYGGLQVQTRDGEWADAPYVEGALTINIADMLARWTGDRWRSTRHRVLPPPAEAPSEELISLIMFMEADMDQVVRPLDPPIGGGAVYAPVLAADYFRERAAAATV
ncbi:isopenicillin N synthase family dioxygenase [Nocardioides cheoyonin]|uniref:isopenicillin N synthase family dioxygenase n=1 Tax=Nocardioides cheoyonin TaxID=3156615 RepID=UPI0032B5D252